MMGYEFKTHLCRNFSMRCLKAIFRNASMAVGLDATLSVEEPYVAENYQDGHHSYHHSKKDTQRATCAETFSTSV